MQERRRRYFGLTALAAVAGGFVVLVLAMSGGPAGAQRVDPASRLQCSGGRIIATQVTHDGVTKDTRTPEQLAGAWAAVMTAQRPTFNPAAHLNAFATGDQRDMAFVDKAERVVAVLSYTRDAQLGWRIESIVECA